MAGDWIKLQKDTPDKPEVLAMAARLNLDPDAVVGKLIRVWSWFDTHTTNGNASCVTFALLDRITCVTGFAEQMALVGWLEQKGHDLTLPNFAYHNGETAKKRALTKNRVEKSRTYVNPECNASSVTKALPEKRREEKINTVERSPTGSRLPADWKLPEEYKNFCQQERPDLDAQDVANRFRDYWVGKAGKDARKADWMATWRNWVRGDKRNGSSQVALTVPSKTGLDPALAKILADDKKATPMPAHLRRG